MLKVIKQADGGYRWVAISSNAFQDRHGEIVSRKALADAVEAHVVTPLLWWHMEKAVLGYCDFQMLHGNMLIESGTFINEQVAKAFANYPEPLEVSVGMRYNPAKLKDGVYEQVRIVERSPLPKGTAANNLTSFKVTL